MRRAQSHTSREVYHRLRHSAPKTVTPRLTGRPQPGYVPAINNGNNRTFTNRTISTKPAISYPEGYSRVSLNGRYADTDLGVYQNNDRFEKYAKILADPWTAEPVGIATGSPCASQVFRSFAQGSGSTGTNGFGFITIAPTMSNDAPAVNYSTPVWSGVAMPTNNGAPGTNTEPYLSLPYNTTAFLPPSNAGLANSIVGRVVSMAFRVTNTTSALNRAGKIRIGQTPFSSTYAKGFSDQSDLVTGNAYQEAASDRTLEYRWQTTSTTDLEYNVWDTTAQERSIPLSYKVNPNQAVLPTCYAMVSCPAGTPQDFDWQAVIVVEYAGYVLSGVTISGATKRLNDVAVVNRVRDMVLSEAQDTGPKPPGGWINWLTRQGDQALNTLFGRPIADKTGSKSGSTTALIRDAIGIGIGLKRGSKQQPKKNGATLMITNA